jgi:hypothetical protein
MREDRRDRKYSYQEALRIWNEHRKTIDPSHVWAMPRRGTPEHTLVRKIMSGEFDIKKGAIEAARGIGAARKELARRKESRKGMYDDFTFSTPRGVVIRPANLVDRVEMGTQTDERTLEDMTIRELAEIASRRRIPYYGRMRREDLITALRA